MRLLDELHQLADVAVQTLCMRRRKNRREWNRWRMMKKMKKEDK